MQEPFMNNDQIKAAAIFVILAVIVALYLISESLENLAKARQAERDMRGGAK